MANSPTRFLDWLFLTADWRISSGRAKGRRYDFEAFPCQLDLAQDDSDNVVVMKSAQMAISEMYTIARPFWHMDAHQRNWGILFPTQQAMRDFFRSRLKSALAVNPYLQARVIAENESNITAFHRVMFLRYTTRTTAISTFDADGATVDEVDLHDMAKLYGAMISRTQGSYEDTHWYQVSTPTYPKFGIHQSLLDSDHHVWLIRCGGCEYDNNLTRKLGSYDAHDAEAFFVEYLNDERFPRWQDYHMPCSYCGKPLDLVARASDVAPGESGGRWVPTHPSRATRGYHLQIFQRMYAGGTAAVLRRMRKNLMDARTVLDRKEWWNFTLGVPYTPQEGRLTDDQLEAVVFGGALLYRPLMHNTVLLKENASPRWMGVDVRQDQYHIWCLESGGSEDSKIVCGVGWVRDAPTLLSLWRDLGEPVFVIDNEPNLSDSRMLVKAMRGKGFRAKFQSGINRTWQRSADSDVLLVNRPIVMEHTKYMIENRKWTLPDGLWDAGAGVFDSTGKVEQTARDHFKSPVMIRWEDPRTGNTSYDFPVDAMGGVDPHYFMAACLAQIATQVRAAPGIVVRVPH